MRIGSNNTAARKGMASLRARRQAEGLRTDGRPRISAVRVTKEPNYTNRDRVKAKPAPVRVKEYPPQPDGNDPDFVRESDRDLRRYLRGLRPINPAPIAPSDAGITKRRARKRVEPWTAP